MPAVLGTQTTCDAEKKAVLLKMWLPKDERRLLAGYYTLIGNIGIERVYRLYELSRLLRFRGYRLRVPEYGESENSSDNPGDIESMKREMRRYTDFCNRINKANKLLAGRSLITCTPHQHELDVVAIGLTVEGYDLGRRYSNALESSGLWFYEYRHHWVWLIVAFFGGAVGTKLIDYFASLSADG